MILGAGRVTHVVDPATPEDVKEELMGTLGEKDATVDRFRAISEDVSVVGLPAGVGVETPVAWTVKVAGDP